MLLHNPLQLQNVQHKRAIILSKTGMLRLNLHSPSVVLTAIWIFDDSMLTKTLKIYSAFDDYITKYNYSFKKQIENQPTYNNYYTELVQN